MSDRDSIYLDGLEELDPCPYCGATGDEHRGMGWRYCSACGDSACGLCEAEHWRTVHEDEGDEECSTT